MLLKQHGMIASTVIRKHVPAVKRIIIARSDGIAFYDDETLEARDSGAAATAAVVGLNAGVASALALGPLESSVMFCDDAVVALYPLDGLHVIAVVADRASNVGEIGAAVDDFRQSALGSHQAEHDQRVAAEQRLRERHTVREAEPARAGAR